MNIIIFTDGASRGNPGRGGWGAVVVDGAKVRELGGREKLTTNNRMELKAAIEGLKVTSENSDIIIYTDSSYLINGITKWVKGWKKIGWTTRAKEEVLNRDLWESLDALTEKRNTKWEYVGGHVGVAGNERCDVIATTFADEDLTELYDGPIANYSIPNILNIEKAALKVETKSKKNAKAYSYVSSVRGEIVIHHSWPECEKRVKGTKGARYKKAVNAEDQEKIISEFKSLYL